MSYENEKLMNLEDGRELLKVLDGKKANAIEESNTTPSAVMSFSDGADGMPIGMEVAIEPVQDLHGYDKPWVGGAGKNLAKPSVNPGTYTPFTGVTVVVNDDYSVKVSGTYAGNSFGRLPISQITLPAGTYIFNGQNNCDSTNKKLTLQLYSITASDQIVNKEDGNDYTFTLSAETQLEVAIGFRAGCSVTNQVMYPMIRLSTVSDATYEPYENICPISGHTGCEITRNGVNLLNTVGRTNGYYLDSSGTPGADTSFCYTDAIPVQAGHKYNMSGKSNKDNNSNRRIHEYDANGNWLRQLAVKNVSAYAEYSVNVTISSDAYYVKVSYPGYTGEGRSDVDINPIFTEQNVYTVQFPSPTPGTVYGGTLTVNKDGSGVLVVDRAGEIFDGSSDENWAIGSPNYRYYIPAAMPAVNNDMNAISSYFLPGIIDAPIIYNKFVIQVATNVNRVNLYFSAASKPANVAELRTLLAANPFIVVYTLATAVTYNIPAPIIKSLLGQNNVWASTGNVNSAEWSADTKSYIDNLFSSITSAEGQTF